MSSDCADAAVQTSECGHSKACGFGRALIMETLFTISWIIPGMKAGSCLPLVGSLQYTTLANSMYWFPLPFQLPVVI